MIIIALMGGLLVFAVLAIGGIWFSLSPRTVLSVSTLGSFAVLVMMSSTVLSTTQAVLFGFIMLGLLIILLRITILKPLA